MQLQASAQARAGASAIPAPADSNELRGRTASAPKCVLLVRRKRYSEYAESAVDRHASLQGAATSRFLAADSTVATVTDQLYGDRKAGRASSTRSRRKTSFGRGAKSRRWAVKP